MARFSSDRSAGGACRLGGAGGGEAVDGVVGAGDQAGRSGWRGGHRTVEEQPGDSGGVLAVDLPGQTGAVADAALGSTVSQPVPDDYLTYLFDLREQGVVLDDIVETTVNDRPATMLTVTTPDSIHGSLGSPEDGMTAHDCYGPQPDLILRLAVVDTGGQTLLIWVRDIAGDASQQVEYDSFESMLDSIRFRS